jgi:hypothetical protein
MVTDRSMEFLTKTNLSARGVENGKTIVQSPADGFLECGRYEFRDLTDLLESLNRTFAMVKEGDRARGSMKRVGKYRRIGGDGNPCFTFGDPLLDSITDEDGALVLSEQRLDLRAAVLADPDYRGGGISTIDVTPFVEALISSQVIEAFLGRGDMSLVECSPERIVVASRNPHVIWNYDPSNTSIKMRFRAFQKNYIFYSKMGADIETWGRDFTSASISSNYGLFLGSFCFSAKTDSDSDTNDDYVDEYEWAVGIPAQTPDGVRSVCTAQWGGRPYTGVVRLGCEVIAP